MLFQFIHVTMKVVFPKLESSRLVSWYYSKLVFGRCLVEILTHLTSVFHGFPARKVLSQPIPTLCKFTDIHHSQSPSHIN